MWTCESGFIERDVMSEIGTLRYSVAFFSAVFDSAEESSKLVLTSNRRLFQLPQEITCNPGA